MSACLFQASEGYALSGMPKVAGEGFRLRLILALLESLGLAPELSEAALGFLDFSLQICVPTGFISSRPDLISEFNQAPPTLARKRERSWRKPPEAVLTEAEGVVPAMRQRLQPRQRYLSLTDT